MGRKVQLLWQLATMTSRVLWMLHRPRGEKVARAVSHQDAPSNNNRLLQLDAAHAHSRAMSLQCNRERLVPHADLVFIQNGMLQPWLDEKGLGDNTQASAASSRTCLLYRTMARMHQRMLEAKVH
jgi:hypothetical protein